MKKLIISTLILIAHVLFAQNTYQSQPPVQNISTDNNVVYRLFSTRNMFTSMKLDIRNVQIWQVQWSMEEKGRMVVPINNYNNNRVYQND